MTLTRQELLEELQENCQEMLYDLLDDHEWIGKLKSGALDVESMVDIFREQANNEVKRALS